MKVLIVEDEAGARDGLFKFLKHSFPTWEILLPCKNGVQGLESIRENLPDIILADIRMPGGDGLAMVRAMRNEGHGAAVIVVSGYPDFESARQCLELGVREYLVKPASVDDLLAAILKCEATLFSNGEFRRLLEGKPVTKRLEPGCLFYFRSPQELSPAQKKALKQEMLHIVGGHLRVQAAEFSNRGEYFFYSQEPAVPRRLNPKALLETLRFRVHGSVIGCARVVEDSEWQSAANQLRRDSRAFLLNPEPAFVVRTADTEEEYTPLRYRLALEKNAVAALQRSDKAAIIAAFQEVQDEFFRVGFDPEEVINATKRYFFFVQSLIKDLDYPKFLSLLAFDPMARLDQALTARDVRDLFQAFTDLVSQPTQKESGKSRNIHIRKALALIEENLASPLSLEEIAEKLGLSSQYLSRCFKAEMGTGFAQYCVRYRIEKAKSLLASARNDVQAIANQLGFGTQKYFGSTFKKETGFTPTEYRQRFL